MPRRDSTPVDLLDSLHRRLEFWFAVDRILVRVDDGEAEAAVSDLLGFSWSSAPRLGPVRRVSLLQPLRVFLASLKTRGVADLVRVSSDHAEDPTDALSSLTAASDLYRFLDSAWILSFVESARLFVVFQPIVELVESLVIGQEALLRGRDESGSVRTAEELFNAAEALGLQYELDRRGRACAIHTAAEKLSPFECLFLNVNPGRFYRSSGGEYLTTEICREAGFDLRRIVFEIVETERAIDIDELERILGSLRQSGARVAIDDLSAGYGSLQYCHQLRPDFAKIDKSMTRGLLFERSRRSIVRMLADLGHELGFRTIAEGVETEEDLSICSGLGVYGGQGYLFGRPGEAPPTLSAQRRMDLAAVASSARRLFSDEPRTRIH